MREKFIKLSFWLSLIAIVSSITTIVLWIVNTNSIAVVTLETFIGVAVTLFALLVTIVLGWQIYKTIEINDKINTINSLESKLHEQEQKMLQLYYETSHFHAHTEAHVSYLENDYVDTYRWLMEALSSSLSLDAPINTEIVLSEMNQCVEKMPKGTNVPKDLREDIEISHNTICQSSKFDCIKNTYMQINKSLQQKVIITKEMHQ